LICINATHLHQCRSEVSVGSETSGGEDYTRRCLPTIGLV